MRELEMNKANTNTSLKKSCHQKNIQKMMMCTENKNKPYSYILSEVIPELTYVVLLLQLER